MTIAVFDLDGTLLAGDCERMWGEYLIKKKLVDQCRYEAIAKQHYEDYLAGHLDLNRHISQAISPIAHLSSSEQQAIQTDFLAWSITLILPAAMELVEEHRRQNHPTILLTASNAFVAKPLARHMGFEHIMTTELKKEDGRYFPEILGTPSFREGKITRLLEWLGTENSLAECYFYSDSHNDLPLLRVVGTPIAVNPDTILRAEAMEKGWRIIDLAICS